MTKTIKLNHITKIEGHASLTIEADGNEVKQCHLEASEGSRYFEGLLVGRKYWEANKITTRICGICSCAHNIASLQAMENALSLEVSHQTEQLRELITTGERIRSHAAHLYFLALPDYLGFESGIDMASKCKKDVQRALRLMKLGNDMLVYLQGRDMHPISTRIGGFDSLPTKDNLACVRKRLAESKKDATDTVKLFQKLKHPVLEHSAESFSLSSEHEYAMHKGMIKSERHKFEQKDYAKFLMEYHEPYGTSNFVVKNGKPYMVGALARLNNNREQLLPTAKNLLQKSGLKLPNNNPFYNNLAQAIELVHYIDRGIEIINKLVLKDVKDEKPVEVNVLPGHGISAIEVPRGTLWHEYKIDADGLITFANIMTPTCQNLRVIEDDIKQYLPTLLRNYDSQDKIALEIEKLIRAYDPCFSCSTHFLKVKWV